MAARAPAPAKTGRPVDLHRRALTLARQRGAAWLEDLQRQADLGDPAAIRAILDLADRRPGPPSRPDVA